MSTAIASGTENLTLNISNEVLVAASLENTFAALLEQLGPGADTPEGQPMPMKLEPWPGGRWYRDLGCATIQNKGNSNCIVDANGQHVDAAALFQLDRFGVQSERRK